jgi:hypothetical protein
MVDIFLFICLFLHLMYKNTTTAAWQKEDVSKAIRLCKARIAEAKVLSQNFVDWHRTQPFGKGSLKFPFKCRYPHLYSREDWGMGNELVFFLFFCSFFYTVCPSISAEACGRNPNQDMTQSKDVPSKASTIFLWIPCWKLAIGRRLLAVDLVPHFEANLLETFGLSLRISWNPCWWGNSTYLVLSIGCVKLDSSKSMKPYLSSRNYGNSHILK